jgi:hypothetical protein
MQERQSHELELTVCSSRSQHGCHAHERAAVHQARRTGVFRLQPGAEAPIRGVALQLDGVGRVGRSIRCELGDGSHGATIRPFEGARCDLLGNYANRPQGPVKRYFQARWLFRRQRIRTARQRGM